MPDPLRILTGPYEHICTNFGCDQRRQMSRSLRIRAALLTYARALFLCICCGFIGANISLLLHAQPIPQLQIQTAKLEVSTALLEAEVDTLKREQQHTDGEVSTMQGIGVGLGAALGMLQILQIMLGRDFVKG